MKFKEAEHLVGLFTELEDGSKSARLRLLEATQALSAEEINVRDVKLKLEGVESNLTAVERARNQLIEKIREYL